MLCLPLTQVVILSYTWRSVKASRVTHARRLTIYCFKLQVARVEVYHIGCCKILPGIHVLVVVLLVGKDEPCVGVCEVVPDFYVEGALDRLYRIGIVFWGM